MATIPIFTLPIIFTRPNMPTRAVYGFADTFDRAAAPTLGRTSREDKPWEISLATGINAGIDASGAAFFARASGGPGQAVVDGNDADGTLTVTMKTKTTPGQAGLCFRWANAQNYLTFSTLASGTGYYRINRVVGNATTVLATTAGITPANGDKLKVVLNGDLITCYVNGVQVLQVTEPHNNTATKHGLYNTEDTTTARWENITFEAS